VHRSSAIFNYEPNNPKRWTDDKLIWMNAEYIRTMPLEDLLPMVKAELKANKLWRDEYDEEGEALAAAIPSTADLGPDGRPSTVAAENREIGSRNWLIYTVDVIRQRFFTLKDFSSQGRAYFSEDFDFDTAAVEKNLKKFPDLREWLPELANRFEIEFAKSSPPVLGGVAAASADGVVPYTEENIETIVKAFTVEKGTKLGVIMNGARTLITGVAVGPSMLSVFEIIGLERTLLRLRSQVAWN
jgi:glutamyl-tRNA synthetase